MPPYYGQRCEFSKSRINLNKKKHFEKFCLKNYNFRDQATIAIELNIIQLDLCCRFYAVCAC
jgi:hypothetical protein